MASGLTNGPGLRQDPIPTYRIDLSLPPEERYKIVARDFASRMQELTPLFNEVLSIFIPWAAARRCVEFLASLILRRLYSSEETEELRGISETSAVKMHILVALNVLLDSLLGCTSGAVLTQPRKGSQNGPIENNPSSRMMHFRTLDWGMDGLRRILVALEFVDSKSDNPEKVIARSITYAGFVGCLTGVRKNLSLSLNFRPNHICSSVKLRMHQVLVLLGYRPSIASLLRGCILPRAVNHDPSFDEVTTILAESHTAPCYLILCSGTGAAVVERDLYDGKVRTAEDFIVHTNHDVSFPSTSQSSSEQEGPSKAPGMETLVEESKERMACIQSKWNALQRRQEIKGLTRGTKPVDNVVTVQENVLEGWVKAYPISNECTHFGCILDPLDGTIRWLKRG